MINGKSPWDAGYTDDSHVKADQRRMIPSLMTTQAAQCLGASKSQGGSIYMPLVITEAWSNPDPQLTPNPRLNALQNWRVIGALFLKTANILATMITTTECLR